MFDIIGAVQGLMTLAQEAPVGKPAWDTFAQYGVLGLAVLGLAWFVHKMLNQMWTRNAEELAREVARADRLENETRSLNAVIQDQAIPALLAAANAMTECTELLRDRDYTLRQRNGDVR
jgi:hypothetical protein